MISELIVTSLTRGAYEEVFNNHLGKSLKQRDFVHRVLWLPGGSWVFNIAYRWELVRGLAKQHPETDLLCIDADEEVHEDPWPILRVVRNHCDFGACVMRGLNEPESLLGATIFLPAGPKRIALLDAWIAENSRCPQIWDQTNLQNLMGEVVPAEGPQLPPKLLERLSQPGPKYKHAIRGVKYLRGGPSSQFVWCWLPVEYGTPYDPGHRHWVPRNTRPIIEHYHVGFDMKQRGLA